ncbi:hypothetical protein ACKWTF_012240 [Chironomus riparius]
MNTNNIYYHCDDNCNFECENSNQCNYQINNYNNDNASFNLNHQQYPQQQQIQNNPNENYQYYNNISVNFNSFGDSVVPSNFYENNNENASLQSYQMHQQPNINQSNFYSNATESVNILSNVVNTNNFTNTNSAYTTNCNYAYAESLQTHPPCHGGPQPWNFAQCYGYYGDAPCQFSNVIDMEDFMNNEKRKEKSRDAARCRRSRETEIFTELANSLPIKQEEIDHLDKASVMRLSIAYLNIRNMLDLFPKIKNLDIPIDKAENSDNPTVEEEEETKIQVLKKLVEDEKFALLALDGFLLVLNNEGDITYVSENISEYLGLSKIDLLGQPIWDYAHACDHDELREVLNGRKTSPSEVVNGSKSGDCNPLLHRDMMLRLKCTLTKSGRFVNIKSASYKVIHLTGHIIFKEDGYRQLIVIAKPLAHPSNIEVPLGSSTFLTKHTLDMKFSFVDSPKMFELMGYKPEHLLGKSLYDYHHGNDSENLMTSFKCLISKGQTETNRYRFLARNGGYVWIVTQATVVFEKQKPQSVVCVNYVVSGIENEFEIYSCAQLEAQQELSKAIENLSGTSKSSETHDIKVIKKDNIVLGINDLKQQKQRKSSADSKNFGGNNKSAAKLIVADKKEDNNNNNNHNSEQSVVAINPINTIKVNNCEIINRPRSVTASIFSHPTILTPKITITKSSERKVSIKTSAKRSIGGPPLKIFRPSTLQNATSVTSTIFAPRTKDMNKGYLMFSEDDTGLTMLKDEPDDLTHLAPTAGDSCISLDESAPFFDMFDDFIIPDNYNALLTDELNSLDSQCSKTTSSSSCSNDPFINYRDESSDMSNSPHLLSPGLSKSPDANSIPSLCSPGSLPEDELAFMTLNMDDDLDMSMRAPYISMSESSELPLLIAEDLMWGAQPDIKESLNIKKNEKVEIPIVVEQQQQIIESSNKTSNLTYQNVTGKNAMDSSLASLLCSQLLQQQLLNHQQQQKQSEEQTQHNTINKSPEFKIKILDNLIDTNDHLEAERNPKIASNVEWTMNDLLQLKKQHHHSGTKITIEKYSIENTSSHINTSVSNINQIQSGLENNLVKLKEKTNHHKRPSISYEINSKRVKGQETIKTTPQLLQQLMTSTGINQKNRQKVQQNINNSDGASLSSRWTSNAQSKPHQPASNSVLMNLLVSGCDVSAGYTCLPRPKVAKA